MDTEKKITHEISDVYIKGGLLREIWDWQSPSHSNRRQPIESTASLAGLPRPGDDVIRQELGARVWGLRDCRTSTDSPWGCALHSDIHVSYVIKTKSGTGKCIIHHNKYAEEVINRV